MSVSFWEIAVIGAVIFLVFGQGKISGLMADVAQGIEAFKSGLKEETLEAAKTPMPAAQAQAAPVETI